MRIIDKIKGILLKNKKLLKEKYGIVNLKIFGSYARGEETPKSDIDILFIGNGACFFVFLIL